MLTPQTVIDFEGFRFLNQLFTIKELSVRSFDYNETILLKPAYPIQIVCQGTEKFYLGYE